jgi:hypothetical protein
MAIGAIFGPVGMAIGGTAFGAIGLAAEITNDTNVFRNH